MDLVVGAGGGGRQGGGYCNEQQKLFHVRLLSMCDGIAASPCSETGLRPGYSAEAKENTSGLVINVVVIVEVVLALARLAGREVRGRHCGKRRRHASVQSSLDETI